MDLYRVGHVTACSSAAQTAAAAAALADQRTQGGTGSVRCFWPTQLTDALPHLTQMTHLELTYYTIDKDNSDEDQQRSDTYVSLSGLQHLKSLSLSMNKSHRGVIGLGDLPVGLTLLRLYEPPVLSLSTTHHLIQLTQLQQLSLIDFSEFHPLLLSSLSQLTGLVISCCSTVSTATQSEIMQALGQLRQLKYLDLHGGLHADISFNHMYAAVTASNQLTSLYLMESTFPVGADRYMFSAAHPRMFLRVLAASADLFNCPGSFKRLATCCPRLQQLNVNNDTHTDQSYLDLQGVRELTRLSALTDLTFFGLDLTDDLLGSIACCTGLKELLLDIDPWQKITVTAAG